MHLRKRALSDAPAPDEKRPPPPPSSSSSASAAAVPDVPVHLQCDMLDCGKYGQPLHVRNTYDRVVRACEPHMRCVVCGVVINPQKQLAVWMDYRRSFCHTFCWGADECRTTRQRQQVAFPATVRTLIDTWMQRLEAPGVTRKSFYDEVLRVFLEKPARRVFPEPEPECRRKKPPQWPAHTFCGGPDMTFVPPKATDDDTDGSSDTTTSDSWSSSTMMSTDSSSDE